MRHFKSSKITKYNLQLYPYNNPTIKLCLKAVAILQTKLQTEFTSNACTQCESSRYYLRNSWRLKDRIEWWWGKINKRNVCLVLAEFVPITEHTTYHFAFVMSHWSLVLPNKTTFPEIKIDCFRQLYTDNPNTVSIEKACESGIITRSLTSCHRMFSSLVKINYSFTMQCLSNFW